MSYNADSPVDITVTLSSADIRENFRAMKEDKIVAAASAVTADLATKLTNARTISLTGDATGSTTFDGSADVSISVDVTSADSAAACTGNAATATKFENARNINGVAFDGSADITITQVNGKNIATTDQIPASLPANGGNADTVDGKHAGDFAPAGYGLGTRAICKNNTDLNSLLGAGCGFYCGYNMANAPDTGWWYVTHIDHVYTDGWAMQQAVAYGSMNSYSAGKVFVRVCTGNTWQAWQ